MDIAKIAQSAEGQRDDAAAAWIACVATVFAAYGHRVRQSRIAAEAYGDLAHVPAPGGFAIARALDRMWSDDDGGMFRVAVEALYDAALPRAHPDPLALVESLGAGDPLIVCCDAHPVVLALLELARGDGGWSVRFGSVLDPAGPAGRATMRPLTATEAHIVTHGGARAFVMRVTFPGLG